MRHSGALGRFVGAILSVFVAAQASAQTTVVWKTWTGSGSDSNWTTPANWAGGTAPANDGTANVSFGATARTQVNVNAAQSISALKFDFSSIAGSYPAYYFGAGTGATLTLGTGGLTLLAPTSTSTAVTSAGTSSSSFYNYYPSVEFGPSLGVILGSDQTWALGNSSYVFFSVDGTISGPGKLTLSNGDVSLSGNNTYAGGTVLNNATVALGSNTALGTGPVTITGPSYLEVFHNATGEVTRALNNALNLASDLTTYTFGGTLTFGGPVTLSADSRITNYGHPLFFDGNVGESGGARKLTIWTDGAVVLSGNNTYSGGTAVEYGALIFRNATSVPPSNSLTAWWSGYIGAGFTTNLQTGFIDRFDKSTMAGTIGLDTDPSAATATTFSSPINLTGFGSNVQIGSATRAILSGAITPQGTTYLFGGAGGTLTIQSQLTGANDVLVQSSPSRELTLNLANATNNYTGRTTVSYSAIVFAAGAMGSGLFKTYDGGYIGTSDATLSPASFIAKFDPDASAGTPTGVIGFDSTNLTTPRTISDPIDLSQRSITTMALGTTSAVTLSGAITLPAGQNAYYFTGYKGGQLTINTSLSGTAGVRIGGIIDSSGNTSVAYPTEDPNDGSRVSTVALNGANTYSGGTWLIGGRLLLGNANALGSGPLQVASNYYSSSPARLETSMSSNPTFANPLVVGGTFEVGGANGFTLSGNVADSSQGYPGPLVKLGNFNLTLSGANSNFSGGFDIGEGTITFATDNAAGKGRLSFGYYSNSSTSATPTAAFTSPAPTVNGLSGYTSNGRVSIAGGSTLTINENTESSFSGQLQGAGGIQKTGTGSLRLETATSSYTGPIKLSNGTLDLAASGALGNNTVTLNGPARLVVEHGVTLNNPIAFGSSGGTLAGNGTFASAVTIAANSSVAPGNSVGLLTFSSGLTFDPDSGYQVQVQDAAGTPGSGWDAITVNGTLAFTATLGKPFTLFLSSLNSSGTTGDAANFVATNAYSWQIATATGGITGFTPGAVVLKTGGFTNSLGIGSFNVTTSGNSLLVNFTPVPEPSTWALLITGGLGIIAFAFRRHPRRDSK